ncbi:MAG: preprotein translocase subunit YajC [Candidatus Marinimicrobia bacterium]|nr:preprotein translocase subunit YajC [Candidatus Neomarinimicrobiota bacterium]
MLSIMLQAANGAAEGSGRGGIMSFLPFILIIVILWFLMIMPQRKRQKETKKMLETLQPKDKVVTIGGIIATVQKVKNDIVVLGLGKDIQMEVRKSAIASKLGEEPKKDTETKK